MTSISICCDEELDAFTLSPEPVASTHSLLGAKETQLTSAS